MTRQQREAADWAARMHGTPSGADHAAFAAWRTKAGNADAYALAEEDLALATQVSRARIDAKVRSKRFAPGGLRWATATIAAVALALGYAWYLQRSESASQMAAGPSESRALWLADGTLVTLADGARLEPQLTATERRVVLRGGRASFDVAHDAARPFRVVAGRSETIALGTLFEIDARRVVPRIKLIKGSVEVRLSGSNKALRLAPGESADVPDDGPRRLHETDSADVTTQLAADNLPLGAVIDRANIAAAKPIRLADPVLASLAVTGRFDVSDSHALARKLAAALDLVVDVRTNEIILRKK